MRKQNSLSHHSSPIEILESRTMLSAAETAAAQIAILSTTGAGAHIRYNYDITLRDTGTTPLETFWFAWTPRQDYMKTKPITVSGPTGWTDMITGGGAGDGFAIQWTTTSSAVAAGQSPTGFKFTSADSPAVLTANSVFFPNTPTETSVVYIGAAAVRSGISVRGFCADDRTEEFISRQAACHAD